MPKLTLLDIQKANGRDKSLAVVEAVMHYAPEVASLASRTIPGTKTTALVRLGVPRARFAAANGGTQVTCSEWGTMEFELAYLNTNIEVADSVLKASTDSEAEVLAREAVGHAKGAIISVGLQRIYGRDFDKKGHPGLAQMVDDSMILSADPGHDTIQPGTTSVFLICEGMDGVQGLFGQGKAFTLDPFTNGFWGGTNEEGKQVKIKGKESSLSAYLGLSCFNKHAVARIINISETNPLTDKLVAKCLKSFPIGLRPTVMWMNREANYQLQCSRPVTLIGGANGASATISPEPTSSMGVSIIVTDSILDDESAISETAKVDVFKN